MFPLALLPQVKGRPKLVQTGAYLLLGPRPDGEGGMLYVAELPDVLSDVQKRNRVKNLLADLSRRNLIAPECRLQTAQVKTVVDVRELPLSRKKGFSKSAFCDALATHGIAYLHAPALGCPKPIRNQYKADGNWQTYTREFLKYIQTQDASLRELVKIAQATPACLVCFEADYSTCHRTYVARAARQLGGPTVMHLTAKTALPDLGYQQAA